jgi:hypothetical protein
VEVCGVSSTRPPSRGSHDGCPPSSLWVYELDAIKASQLRELVQHAIERHLPADQLRVLQEAEASERQFLGGLVGLLEQAGKFRGNGIGGAT